MSSLLQHFEESGVSLNWCEGLLLHLGMDGPNVNFRFQQKLANSMSDNSN